MRSMAHDGSFLVYIYILEFRKITSDRMSARAVDLLVGQINDTRGGYIFILLVMAAVVLLTNLITGCRRAFESCQRLLDQKKSPKQSFRHFKDGLKIHILRQIALSIFQL
jgi:hypothetical protein